MTDWLMVIITAVYVAATIVICVFNGKSAKAAKEQTETARQQIDEMIRQYNESNRPIVIVRFEIIRSGLLCFVLENIGPVVAEDIKIRINDEFIDNLEKEDKQIRLRETTEATLFLSSHQKLYILLGGQSQFSKIASVPAKFDISYNGKYNEHTEIDLWQYRFMLTYSSELEDISQHLKHIENEAKTYHDKHLKAISKSSPVSVLVHTGDESKKFEIFKAVCMNPGSTTEHLAEIVEIQKEDVFDILIELDRVDRFVQAVPYDDDDFHAKWYRR